MNIFIKKLNFQVLLFFLLFTSFSFSQSPPFELGVGISSTILTPSSVQHYTSRPSYLGRGQRTLFDRTAGGNISVNAYLFSINWSDGLSSQFRVNPELGDSNEARRQVENLAVYIGRIPYQLRAGFKNIDVNRGTTSSGIQANFDLLIIYTEAAKDFIGKNIFEEGLIHEGAHSSLDAIYRDAQAWRNAQNSDNNFLTNYGKNNSYTEDFAETFLGWFALRYVPNSLTASQRDIIANTIPNRLAFLDTQSFNLAPYTRVNGNSGNSNEPATMSSPSSGSVLATTQNFTWNRPQGATHFDLLLGTSVGGTNIKASSVTTQNSVQVSNLPANGQTIYARLWTSFNGDWKYRDYTYTAASQAVSVDPAVITSPSSGSVLATTQNFTWNRPQGATQFDLLLGTSVGGANIKASSVTTQNSAQVSNLPANGQTIYARLWTSFSGDWRYRDYTFTAASQAVSIDPAVITSPSSGSVLSTSQNFTWNNPRGATAFDLLVGTSVGGTNIKASSVTTQTSVRVSNLPANGQTIYVRLWTSFSGDWRYRDYTFKAASGSSTTNGLSNGYYQIVPRSNTNMALAACCNSVNNSVMKQYNKTNNTWHRFFLERGSDGSYKIQANTGRVITIHDWNNNNGAQPLVFDDFGYTNQRWVLEDVGSGYFYITPKYNTNKALAVLQSQVNTNSGDLTLWDKFNGGSNFMFKFVPANSFGKNADSKNDEFALENEFESNRNNLDGKNVIISPNPVHDDVNIILKGFDSAEITITNILGKIIYKTSIEEGKLTLNKSDLLKSGVYLVMIFDADNNKYLKRMVIN